MAIVKTEVSLQGGWELSGSLCEYLFCCIVITLIIRIIGGLLKAFETCSKTSSLHYFKKLWFIFRGFNKNFTELSDHWLGAMIGFTEVSFFPVLIVTDNLAGIGGWLALKTVIGFKTWRDEQRAYNRFLVQNILNLGASFFVTLPYFTTGT